MQGGEPDLFSGLVFVNSRASLKHGLWVSKVKIVGV
jgi:hypothetical protein